LAESTPGVDMLGRAHVWDKSGRLPYALLEVEGASRERAGTRALFPVYHREDFRAVDHAVSIATEGIDVIVSHAPIKFPWFVPLKGAQPTMRVMVLDRNAEEKMRELGGVAGAKAFMESIHYQYEPLVDRFQGRWLYLEKTDR